MKSGVILLLWSMIVVCGHSIKLPAANQQTVDAGSTFYSHHEEDNISSA
jgi:hypothetical protein